MLAVLTVSDVWRPDTAAEAESVFDSSDPDHPGVGHLLRSTARFYLGGSVQGLQLPVHYDFTELRRTPAQLRAAFDAAGWQRVVAFQTRNPMHRAHVELTRRAAVEADAKPAHPSGGGHDQARRCGPLHPRAGVPAHHQALPGELGHAGHAAAGHAHGRPSGGGVARHHPQEPRRLPLHRGSGPRRPGVRRFGQSLLRPLRRPGHAPGAYRRAGRDHGAVQDDGVRPRQRQLPPGGRGGRGHGHLEHQRHRASGPPGVGGRHPRVVQLSRGGGRAAPHPSSEVQAGASPCSSPGSAARASPPSPTRSCRSCWSGAGDR